MAAKFKLQMEPAERMLFSGILGVEPVVSSLVIANTLKERVAIKIKCTSNEMFRIHPPVTQLNPGEQKTVHVVFQASTVPEHQNHFLAIYYLKMDTAEKSSPRAWQENKPDGCKRLQIDFKILPKTQEFYDELLRI